MSNPIIATMRTSTGERIRFRESDANCLSACFCSPTDTTASKVATLVLYTGVGAIIGGAVGGPPGAGIGAGVGAGVAIIKITSDHLNRS